MPPITATPIPTERRFPLALQQADSAIRQLYEEAKQGHWNPETDIDWATNAIAGSAADARAAAARVWSRRAWVEYTGMTETPALVIRLCLERDRESDPKYFLTVRNTEEAWHIEVFHRYAEACGGYVDRPADPAWEPVFNRTQYREALDAGTAIDAYVTVHCTFVDALELALVRAWHAAATEPLARAVLARCVADCDRHARFGQLYAKRRLAALDEAGRAGIVAALMRHVREVEFAGYHCVGLATAIDASADCADLARTEAAGLGAVNAQAEIACFRTSLSATRQLLAGLGIDLPAIEHPRLGPL
jgi:hypothetical protein